MSDQPRSVVIVGAGHSGSKAAAALRKHGWPGSITLLGQEPLLPYDRPPLSKGVLLRKKSTEQCSFFHRSWYEEKGIALKLGQPVSFVDRPHQRVMMADGDTVPYDQLVFATGSALRPLNVPGAHLGGVLPLRTPQHALAISDALQQAQRIVVIGAGVIGLEVASAATELGCKVHVVESAAVAMGRGVPTAASNAMLEHHRLRGVDVRLGMHVATIDGDMNAREVRLATGEIVACDLVVYGIGVTPCTELANAADLLVDNGIRTSAFLQTADPQVFACGDVCRYDSTLYGHPMRLENWRNAEDQADIVARNLLGQRRAFDEVPWFWSNQYDLTLQVAGVPGVAVRTEIESVGSSRLYLSFASDDSLCAVSGLGSVRDIAAPIKTYKQALSTKRETIRAAPESGVHALAL